MHFPTSSCYRLPLKSEKFPQTPILINPQSITFYPKYDGPSFTYIPSNSKSYGYVYFNVCVSRYKKYFGLNVTKQTPNLISTSPLRSCAQYRSNFFLVIGIPNKLISYCSVTPQKFITTKN